MVNITNNLSFYGYVQAGVKHEYVNIDTSRLLLQSVWGFWH